MHSTHFGTFKLAWQMECVTLEELKEAVECEAITPHEYEEITGEVYA